MLKRATRLTALILVVQAIPGMQWQAAAGAWRLVSGCAAVDSLPDITLQLGGFDFMLSPRQYIIMVCTSLSCIARTYLAALLLIHFILTVLKKGALA